MNETRVPTRTQPASTERLDGVLQTIFTGPGHPEFRPGNVGNCAAACFATILDVPLERVPNLADFPSDYDPDADPLVEEHGGLWYRSVRRWLRERFLRDFAGYAYPGDGFDWWAQQVRDNDDVWPRYALGSVQSPRGDFKHCVVMNADGVVVWDPHPNQDAYGLEIIEFEAIVGRYDDPAPADPDPWADRMLATGSDDANDAAKCDEVIPVPDQETP